MRRDYKCQYCKKNFAMLWAKERHERQCKEFQQSSRPLISEVRKQSK